jgi:hypothetical protein
MSVCDRSGLLRVDKGEMDHKVATSGNKYGKFVFRQLNYSAEQSCCIGKYNEFVLNVLKFPKLLCLPMIVFPIVVALWGRA